MVKFITYCHRLFVVPFLVAWILDLILRRLIHLYENDILNLWDKASYLFDV